MMFGIILTIGIEMISKAEFNQRNVTIVALSLTVGIGFTSGTEAYIWHIFPQIIQDVFAGNCVAVVFVVSIILSLVLPKDMDIKKIKYAFAYFYYWIVPISSDLIFSTIISIAVPSSSPSTTISIFAL